MRVLLPVIASAGALISLVALAGGVALLASGHLRGLPFVLVPLGLAAVLAGLGTAGRRSLERKTAGLIEDMDTTLGSTTASRVRALFRPLIATTHSARACRQVARTLPRNP